MISFRQAVAEATVTVTGLDGVPRDAPFDWARGETMPFDRVRAVHAEGDRLLLGTDFGLRRLAEGAMLATDDGLFATGNSTPEPVVRLGRPDAAPLLLLAQTARGACLELASATATPQPCADAAGLATRRVVESGFWRWTKGDGRVAGQYLLSDGSAVNVALPLQGGLPHDILRDRARCDGIEVEVWGNLPVSTRLQGGVPVRLDPAAGVTQLHCQTSRAELGRGQALPAGLHGFGAGGAALATAAGWQPEGAVQAQGLAERAAGVLPWEAARLRIRLQDGAASADYRGLDDVWHDLPWASGRLSVDTPLALSAANRGVQALTGAGFAGLIWRGGSQGGLGIDPSALLLATPDDRAGFADCTPNRVETWDGSVQAAPDRPGGPVALRCADGRVFLGQPTGPVDRGAFAALTDDPFVERLLVDLPDFWTWTRKGAVAGTRGGLKIAFKGEPVGLNAGRLTIDDYTAIAAPFAETIEFTSPEGWWRQPAGDMALQAATRGPGRPAEVTGLASERNRDGVGLLCLTGATRQIMPADGPLRSVEECRDWTGQDEVWDWHQTETGPLASGIALNGVPMTRTLEAGRFADLIVTGAPSAQPTGEIVAPTRIDATVIGAQGVQGIYKRDRPGALVRGSTGVPQLVDARGVLALGEAGPVSCPALQGMAARLPEGVLILRIELRDRIAATVTLQAPAGREQILLPCAEVDKALSWAEVMDVSDRPRFMANAAEWPDSAGQLAVAVTPQGFDLGAGGTHGVSIPGLPEGGKLALFSGPNGRATFLLSERDFTRIHTDHAIRLVAQQAGPIAPLAGPFAPAEAAAVPQAIAPTDVPDAPPAPDLQPAPQAPPAPPSPAPAPQPDPSVDQPDTSPLRKLTRPDARAVQAALRARGLYRGAIDGAVGPMTRAAIRQWQQDRGSTPTGTLTDNQFDALLAGGVP